MLIDYFDQILDTLFPDEEDNTDRAFVSRALAHSVNPQQHAFELVQDLAVLNHWSEIAASLRRQSDDDDEEEQYRLAERLCAKAAESINTAIIWAMHINKMENGKY